MNATVKSQEQHTCPQCDGAGAEGWGSKPVICRRCKGAGVIAALSKTATVSRPRLFAKMAEAPVYPLVDDDDQLLDLNDLSGPGEDEFVGTGVDEVALVPGSRAESEIKFCIISILKTFSPEKTIEIFEKTAAILNDDVGALKKTLQDTNITEAVVLDFLKTRMYIFSGIDRMDAQQLRFMLCETRRIS